MVGFGKCPNFFGGTPGIPSCVSGDYIPDILNWCRTNSLKLHWKLDPISEQFFSLGKGGGGKDKIRKQQVCRCRGGGEGFESIGSLKWHGDFLPKWPEYGFVHIHSCISWEPNPFFLSKQYVSNCRDIRQLKAVAHFKVTWDLYWIMCVAAPAVWFGLYGDRKFCLSCSMFILSRHIFWIPCSIIPPLRYYSYIFFACGQKGLYRVFEDPDSNELCKIRKVLYVDGQERVKETVSQDMWGLYNDQKKGNVKTRRKDHISTDVWTRRKGNAYTRRIRMNGLEGKAMNALVEKEIHGLEQWMYE